MTGGMWRRFRSRSGDGDTVTAAPTPTVTPAATTNPGADLEPVLLQTLREGVHPVLGGLVHATRARLALVEAAGNRAVSGVRFNMGYMFAEFEKARETQARHTLLSSAYDSPLLAKIDSVFDRCIPMYEEAFEETRRGVESVDVDTLKRSQELVRAADAMAQESNACLRSLGIPVPE